MYKLLAGKVFHSSCNFETHGHQLFLHLDHQTKITGHNISYKITTNFLSAVAAMSLGRSFLKYDRRLPLVMKGITMKGAGPPSVQTPIMLRTLG